MDVKTIMRIKPELRRFLNRFDDCFGRVTTRRYLDLYIEGLVHVTALPGDYYHFDAAHQRLTGEGKSTVAPRRSKYCQIIFINPINNL